MTGRRSLAFASAAGEAVDARRQSMGRARAEARASAAPRVPVVHGRPCEVQRVARACLDRPRSGWRASCCIERPPGRRFLVTSLLEKNMHIILYMDASLNKYKKTVGILRSGICY